MEGQSVERVIITVVIIIHYKAFWANRALTAAVTMFNAHDNFMRYVLFTSALSG